MAGLAWNLGHAMFFIAFVLFGILTIGLRRLVPFTMAWKRTIANVATVAALLGATCFMPCPPLSGWCRRFATCPVWNDRD